MEQISLELICAGIGGLIGAVSTMVSNEKKETLTEAMLGILIGVIFGMGAGTRWADDAVWSAIIGIFSGAAGGVLVETVRKVAPDAVGNIINGWVGRLGGKVKDEDRTERNKPDSEL